MSCKNTQRPKAVSPTLILVKAIVEAHSQKGVVFTYKEKAKSNTFPIRTSIIEAWKRMASIAYLTASMKHCQISDQLCQISIKMCGCYLHRSIKNEQITAAN